MLKSKRAREKRLRWTKNQRSELERGDHRGTVAHRHAIMRRLGLIYTRVRRRHYGKSIARPKERETSVALFKRRSLILIGSLPLFQPGVPLLEFVSSAEDYGESETGIVPRNEVNNYSLSQFWSWIPVFCRKLRRIRNGNYFEK